MDYLRAADVRHIARLPKVDGQKLLARRLHLNYIELEEDLRMGSFLDYHYDLLQFATSRGMPWDEVAACVMFGHEFFHQFLSSTLPEAVCALRNLAVVYVDTGRIGLGNTKKIAQYFTSTVFPHHKLYQFVFMEEREDLFSSLHLAVEVPDTPHQLKHAETRDSWEYKRRVQNVKNMENEKMQMLIEEGDKVKERAEEIENNINKKLEGVEDVAEVDFKSAEQLVTSLVADHLDIVQGDVGLDIMKIKDSADIALAMQAIPVPQHIQSFHKIQSKANLKPKSPPASRKSSGKSRKTSSKRKK
ncbi:unnamed protein product [Clavelina lepadiformis]|uniref:Uncharacterized protein n=1 Tax=Clavelina lepadiformis TaxID=159417 RepID=A0ABP0FAU8_CLALP